GGARGEPAAHEGANGEVGRREGLRQGGPSLQPGVKTLARAYDAVIFGMAALAAFLMAAMMVVICVDVLLRNLGYHSSAPFFAFPEYALRMVACMGAPWLVREKGHIYVEILLMTLSERARARMTVAIGLACIALCLVLAWHGFDITWQNFVQNEKDVRSLDMPR